MAYIGRQQDGFGVRSRFIYTATGGQTTFDTDDSSNALSYSDGAYVDVYLNGVLLDPSDYTATSLTSIVLDSGASADDVLEVIVYDVFSVFSGTFTNGITASEATITNGISAGSATVTGDLTVDTNTLYVDSTNNRVGIGTTSPEEALHVYNPTANINAVIESGDANAYLAFKDNSTTGYAHVFLGASGNDMTFFSGGSSERMRLDSSGNLLVGKTSTGIANVGHQIQSNGLAQHVADGAISLQLNRKSSNGDIAQFRKDGTTVGGIGIDSGGFYVDGEANHTGLRFKGGAVTPRLNGAQADNTVGLGNATERFSNLYLGGSLFVGGTGSANELDDYEEGTFTPTYLGSTTNPTVTYDGQTSGSYVKIGRQVIAKIILRTDSVSGGSGNLYIGGLPFAASAASGARAGTLNIGYSSNFVTEYPQSGYINDNDSIVVLTTNSSSDARSSLDNAVGVSNMQTGTNDNFIMATLIYET